MTTTAIKKKKGDSVDTGPRAGTAKGRRTRSTVMAAAGGARTGSAEGALALAERPFCWAFLAVNVAACAATWSRMPAAEWLGCALVALAVAEASTSLFHYWGDRRVFARWPLFCHYDRAYARHHRDPDDIVASGPMGYAQWVGDVALLPVCAPLWLRLACDGSHPGTLACALLWVCTFIAMAADTHRLAHCARSDVPAVARLFQRWGLLLSAESHGKHHELVRRTGRLGYFSVLTGWSNRLQDLVGLGDAPRPGDRADHHGD